MPRPPDRPPSYLDFPTSLFATVLTALFSAYHAIMAVLGLTTLPLALAAGNSNVNADERQHRQLQKRVSRSRSTTPAQAAGDKFPGMVNLSGTLCYMNSVLQAFASLPTLVDHLDRIIDLAIDVDVPTPVTDALADTLAQLNTASVSHPPALRPHTLLAALAPLPQIRRLLATREQQDAHELFVVLAEAVSDEATKVAKEVARARGGLGQALEFEPIPTPVVSEMASLADGDSEASLSQSQSLNKSTSLASSTLRPSPSPSVSASASSLRPTPSSSPAPLPPPPRRAPLPRPDPLALPWEGLLARRRMCRRCGYSDVVRMDTLGGMELPVPRSGDVTLDACIAEYLAAERLDDVTCDMCTARATAAKYAAKEVVDAPAPAMNGSGGNSKPKLTASAKKKRGQVRGLSARLRTMVDAGVPALDTPGIKWETVRTDCVRETAVTRAPRTLRFHFVRSEYTPYGQLLKKTARVAFPLMFDLGQHMARGVWEPRDDGQASVASLIASNATAPGGAAAGPPPRALYRLQSAILHYGYTHSSGHFVAIRRKPNAPLGVPGRGWLRISDADVEEVGTDELVDARGQVFMLFYERVDLPSREARPVEVAVEEHPGEIDDEDEGKEEGRDEAGKTAPPPTYPPQGLQTLGLPVTPFQMMAAGPKKSLDSTD